ncbi:MAG: hypothetical protein JO129_03735 [Candidatus Dependentiae bacterium]|nr:hypothetical protein [Candidatus Dependentiae bacterium]
MKCFYIFTIFSLLLCIDQIDAGPSQSKQREIQNTTIEEVHNTSSDTIIEDLQLSDYLQAVKNKHCDNEDILERKHQIIEKYGNNINEPLQLFKKPNTYCTLLQYAAFTRNLRDIEALLTFPDIDINVSTEDCPLSPAMYAVTDTSETIDNFKILINLLHNPNENNKPNKNGETVAHAIVRHQNIIALRFLIRFGGDLNHIDALGYTPLDTIKNRNHMSVYKEMYEMLQDAGAEINLEREAGLRKKLQEKINQKKDLEKEIKSLRMDIEQARRDSLKK